MRRFIMGQADILRPWAEKRMPWPGFRFDVMSNTLGIVVNDRLVAVAVYHDYMPAFKNISLSLAAEDASWSGRDTIGAILGFPFLQLGCERIGSHQPAHHPRARKLIEGVGFQVEGTLRRFFGEEDAVVLGLLKGEAERWLKHCPVGLYGVKPAEIPPHG